MNKFVVLGTNKRGETFTGHELGKDFLKEDFGVNILSIYDDFIVEDRFPDD